MPSIFTLSGNSSADTKQTLGADGKRCKCIHNPRTKRGALLCFVGKSKKTRSGWAFKGKCR